ncbi:MAG: flippase-like domain-containing protein [Bacteroidales bacterium]|nr:flippase-like domain-containing protein [Bacteroidales bacterium]
MTAHMNPTIKKTLKYLASAAVAVLLLWFSFRDVEWASFAAVLKECHWGYVALSMAAGSFAFLLRALRWRRLLMPIDESISTLTTFNGVNIGMISNFVFPRIGEFVRCGVITRRSAPVDPEHPDKKKASYDKVLGTVVLERSWELLVMLLLLAVVVIAGFKRFGGFFVEQIWNPMAQRLDFSIWWIVALLVAVSVAGLWLLWRYRESNAFCSKVWGIFKGILQGFASCLNMDKKWLFFAYTACIWLTYWLMAASTVWAAPFLEHLDIIDALFLSLVGGIGFAVPVPGGIGAFHFVISLALSMVYGIPMEMGIIYATLSHTSQAITQIFFGAVSYVVEAVRK